MQMLMSFLETPTANAAEPVWPTLDQTQQDEIVTSLARLIAKAAVERNDVVEEACDE